LHQAYFGTTTRRRCGSSTRRARWRRTRATNQI
jgi:hypothetical protein